MLNISELNSKKFIFYFCSSDLEKMSEIADTYPIMIDADSSTSLAGGPIGGQTVINLFNNHLSYIFTWLVIIEKFLHSNLAMSQINNNNLFVGMDLVL